MESEVFEVLKTFVTLIVVPLVGGIMYFIKKNFKRLDKVEEDMQEQKTRTAVIESKVDDIRDDIKDIKQGVEKLVERK